MDGASKAALDNAGWSDRVRSSLKRARGDAAVEHTERKLKREITAARHGIRDEIAALSGRIDRLVPPKPEPAAPTEQGPFAEADAYTRKLFDDPRPWLVPEAVAFFSDLLTEDLTVLEWGGGASTPYWCERVGVLHTVEASPGWALILLDYMAKRLDLIDRWRFHFVGANWSSTGSAKRRTGRSLPAPAVRARMQDDYALLIEDRVDAIILDGSVRQRTVQRLAEYLERDQPQLILIDNMEAEYVSRPVRDLDLSAYERHNFWGTQTDRNGVSSPECTTVWVRHRIRV